MGELTDWLKTAFGGRKKVPVGEFVTKISLLERKAERKETELDRKVKLARDKYLTAYKANVKPDVKRMIAADLGNVESVRDGIQGTRLYLSTIRGAYELLGTQDEIVDISKEANYYASKIGLDSNKVAQTIGLVKANIEKIRGVTLNIQDLFKETAEVAQNESLDDRVAQLDAEMGVIVAQDTATVAGVEQEIARERQRDQGGNQP